MAGIFLVLAFVSLVLGVERWWRLRHRPATLAHVSYLVTLFSLGTAAVVYSTTHLTAGFYNIGLGLWHALLGVVLGGVEMFMLTLSREKIPLRVLRRVIMRSVLVTAALLLTWWLGFAQVGPIFDLSASGPRNWATLAHMVIFPAYIVWTLAQIIRLCAARIIKDIRRRPISTAALLLIGLGALGFIWVNVAICVLLLIDSRVDTAFIYRYTPVYLGLCLAGSGLLAAGERIYEEMAARWRLGQLQPLWDKVVELLPEGLHLTGRHLSSEARLQRAYVEISDAMCTLRMPVEPNLDIHVVARRLNKNAVVEDRSHPTISRLFPARTNRREDLDLIHALADAYRDHVSMVDRIKNWLRSVAGTQGAVG